VPSWRSRSILRRVWSDAVTMRLREAASCDLLSAFAIAVATSSVNSAICCSASAGNRSRVVPAAIAPQSEPPTMIGTATVHRTPNRRKRWSRGPERRS
jgi:hypothetical protein